MLVESRSDNIPVKILKNNPETRKSIAQHVPYVVFAEEKKMRRKMQSVGKLSKRPELPSVKVGYGKNKLAARF